MIRKFIKKNKIIFENGTRNSSIVTLIGYALYLELEKEELKKELEYEINNDYFIQDEIDRLWGYCEGRNYGDWWKTEKAKSLYKF